MQGDYKISKVTKYIAFSTLSSYSQIKDNTFNE